MSGRHADYISTTELARFLGISAVAVFKRIKAGRIKAEKIGRSYAIARSYVKEQFPGLKLPEVSAQDHVSIMEAAVLLNISRVAVYKKVKAGIIAGKRIGRHFVIARSEIERIVATRPPSAEQVTQSVEYLSVPQLAAERGVSRVAIFKQIQNGSIPARKVGRHYVIARSGVVPQGAEQREPLAQAQDHLSVPEIAKHLGISRISVFKKIKKGQIEAIKIGRSYAVTRQEFLLFCEGMKKEQNEP